jgi:hypothetical protein
MIGASACKQTALTQLAEKQRDEDEGGARAKAVGTVWLEEKESGT